MGGCFSCRSSNPFKNIVRVVHLNGYVEHFECPIMVSEITGKPLKHFVCTPTQLLSVGSKPLNHDTLLQPGQVYFLLPYSILQADVSSFALLAKKLIAVASETIKCQPKSALQATIPNQIQQWSSPSRNQESDQLDVMAYCTSQRSARAGSWKPILDPIREKSFNRSE